MATKPEAKSHDAAHYTYRLAWSARDVEFVATVVEFPSLSWIEKTRAAHSTG